MGETERLKKELRKKLEKINTDKKEIEEILKAIEGKTVKEKPVKTGYGTSCVQLRNTKKKLLMEF